MDVICPHCKTILEGDESLLGEICNCPKCLQAFEVKTVANKEEIYERTNVSNFSYARETPTQTQPKKNWTLFHKLLFGCLLTIFVLLTTCILVSTKEDASSKQDEPALEDGITGKRGDDKSKQSNSSLPRLDIESLTEDLNSARWILACEEADWMEIMRFPAKFIGKPFYIEGKTEGNARIKQHRGKVWIWQDGDTEKEWCVVFDDQRTSLPDGNILKGDELCVFGIFEEIHEWAFTNRFNACVSGQSPLLKARLISDRSSYGIRNDCQEIVEREKTEREKKNQTTKSSANQSRIRGPRHSEEAERIYEDALTALIPLDGKSKNLEKAYRGFETAMKMGCIPAEGALAHMCWAMDYNDRSRLAHAGINVRGESEYTALWEHVIESGCSPLAEFECGFFKLLRRNMSGLELIRNAAASGCKPALDMQQALSEVQHLGDTGLKIVLDTINGNKNAISSIKDQCELELKKEHTEYSLELLLEKEKQLLKKRRKQQ